MQWRPYAVDFESPDGVFGVVIYAISYEHAGLQVEALRESAVLRGEIVETVPAGRRMEG